MTERARPDRAQGPIAFRYELWRKAIHLSSTIYPIAYAWFLSRERLLVALVASSGIAIAVELGRRTPRGRDRFETLTGAMLRSHERERLVGATWMLLAFTLVVFLAPKPVAIAAMSAVSLGDAFAALVGRAVGRIRLPGTIKTLEGAAACLLVTWAAARWLAGLSSGAALVAAVGAVAAELPSGPGDDNVRVALITAAAAYLGMAVFGMATSAVS